MRQIVLDPKENSKNTLETALFSLLYIFSSFFLNWAVVSKYLKNGPLTGEYKFVHGISHIGCKKKSKILC
jgi:hypothetical protein